MLGGGGGEESIFGGQVPHWAPVMLHENAHGVVIKLRTYLS